MLIFEYNLELNMRAILEQNMYREMYAYNLI